MIRVGWEYFTEFANDYSSLGLECSGCQECEDRDENGCNPECWFGLRRVADSYRSTQRHGKYLILR
jgi:hypothetical protein